MSTFFHKSFAVAEKKTLTAEEVAERIAAAFEHPFVAARHYVREVGVDWISALLTARGRKTVDRFRRIPYRWETGITCSEAAKVFFVAVYRPGFLSDEQITKHLGLDLGAVAIELSQDCTVEDLVEILDLPTISAVYKIASVLRGEEAYAGLPRRREWNPSEEQKEQIVQALAERQPYSQIAREFNTTVNTIREYVRAHGIEAEKRRGRRTDTARNAEIVATFKAGTSAVDIAATYGLTKARVYQILAGVTGTPQTSSFKNNVKNLFSQCPAVPYEVQQAIQTILAWAEEE